MISVIIPTYNRSKLLTQCLSSIAAQHFDNKFETIIVDNSSTDDTYSVVKNFASQHPDMDVNYVFEARPGLVYARHAGVRHSKYEILCFTDDDAVLSNKWLNEIFFTYSIRDDIAAVAGRISIHWDSPPPSWVLEYEPLLGKLDYGSDVIVAKGLYIYGGNFSIKKHILYNLGGFNPDQIGQRLIGDGETGLCHKLHSNGYLIGWSPDALMEHYQFVEVNATYKDIKRRFENNGIGVPYRLYVVECKGNMSLLKNVLKNIYNISILIFKSLLFCRIFNKNKLLNNIFEFHYEKSQILYSMKIIFSKKFREEINNIDLGLS